jgi:outer membrane receptor protein involved in Fe transport
MQTRLNSLFFTFLLILSLHSFAQQGSHGGSGQQTANKTIQGIIVDSISGRPLQFASVAAFRMRDSSLVSGAITDIKGFFTIPDLTYGKYMLRITYVGYKTKEFGPITFNPQAGDTYNAGKIDISLSSASLDAVVIVGEKPFIEMDLDKKVVNVADNVNISGGTAIDVLETVPSVTVDMDGNISYRGSENVTILIDGRPANFSGSRKAALEQIPANMIESIELITNPSAKYDPEGTSGIINIVMKKRKGENTSLITSVNVDSRLGYSGNVAVNHGFKKVSLYASYDYRHGVRSSSGTITRYNYISSPYLQEQESENSSLSDGHSFKIGADYFANIKNTFGFSLNGNIRASSSEGISLNHDFDSGLMNIRNYMNETFDDDTHGMMNGNVYYTRKFSKPGHILQVDLNYSEGNFISFSDQFKDYYTEEWMLIDTIETWLETINSESLNSTILGKIDYTLPFNENSKLETGTHFTRRTMNSDNSYYAGYSSLESLPFDTSRSSEFSFEENVLAAYANYAGKFKKWNYSAGLRFEYASAIPSVSNDTASYVNDYLSVYPTAAISRKIREGEEIQLTYSKRVNRPSFHSLSPFIDYSNSPNLRGGNPYLKPEYIHSVELGYMKIWKKTSLMPSVFYKRTVDLISRYRVTYLDSFSLATYANIASADAFGLELILNQTITKSWKLNLSGSVFKTSINGENLDSDLTAEDFSYSGNLNSTVKITKKLDLQINAMYRGPSVMLQGKRSGMFFVNAGLKYQAIENALTLSLSMRDIFNTQKFNVTMQDETFLFIVDRKWQSQMVTFGITWQINPKNGQSEKKRTRSDEGMSEDDMF